MLPRLTLFEFGDQPWVTGWLREAYMDCLDFVHRTYHPYANLSEPLTKWSEQLYENTGEKWILDLGSGSGEHIRQILRSRALPHYSLPAFILSDIYPNVETYKTLEDEFGNGVIKYISQPVSALRLDNVDTRLWFGCTMFHHLRPDEVHRFFSQLCLNSDGMCIWELTQRSVYRLAMMLLSVPTYAIAPFFAEKRRFSKALVTTLIPIVPLMVAWDGAVSVLRSYTKEEIVQMIPADVANAFTIEYRTVRWGKMAFTSTMLTLTRMGLHNR